MKYRSSVSVLPCLILAFAAQSAQADGNSSDIQLHLGPGSTMAAAPAQPTVFGVAGISAGASTTRDVPDFKLDHPFSWGPNESGKFVTRSLNAGIEASTDGSGSNISAFNVGSSRTHGTYEIYDNGDGTQTRNERGVRLSVLADRDIYLRNAVRAQAGVDYVGTTVTRDSNTGLQKFKWDQAAQVRAGGMAGENSTGDLQPVGIINLGFSFKTLACAGLNSRDSQQLCGNLVMEGGFGSQAWANVALGGKWQMKLSEARDKDGKLSTVDYLYAGPVGELQILTDSSNPDSRSAARGLFVVGVKAE